MKKLLATISLMIMMGCGREADLIQAPSYIFDSNKLGIQAIQAGGKSFQESTRDVTILFYPNTKDMKGFNFSPSEEKLPSWNLLQEQLSDTYRSSVSEHFNNSMPEFQKVQEMAIWINTAGEVRDNAFRKKYPQEREKFELEQNISTAQDTYLPQMQNAREGYICYFNKRPRPGQKYACKSKPEGEFTNTKIPDNCEFMDRFEFVFATAEDETSYGQFKSQCVTAQAQLDAQTSGPKERVNELALKIELQKNIRDAGKSVVLELLEAVEAHTKGIFVSTTSNTEKELDCPGQVGVKCMSKLVLSDDLNKIENFVLYSSFGVNSDKKLEVLEYSIENSGITNARIEMNKYKVKVLNFTLNTALFTMVTEDLSLTTAPDMGLRFVGKAKVYFKDSQEWRWAAVKLEFDRK